MNQNLTREPILEELLDRHYPNLPHGSFQRNILREAFRKCAKELLEDLKSIDIIINNKSLQIVPAPCPDGIDGCRIRHRKIAPIVSPLKKALEQVYSKWNI